MVEGQRADQVRASGKSHDTDTVVRAALDEFFRHLLDRFEPVGALRADGEILGQHGTRDVDHEHDVDAAGLRAGDRFSELRTGQGKNETSQRKIKQTGEKIPRAGAPAAADFCDRPGGGKHHARRAAEFSFQPREKRNEQQQPKKLRLREDQI